MSPVTWAPTHSGAARPLDYWKATASVVGVRGRPLVRRAIKGVTTPSASDDGTWCAGDGQTLPACDRGSGRIPRELFPPWGRVRARLTTQILRVGPAQLARDYHGLFVSPWTSRGLHVPVTPDRGSTASPRDPRDPALPDLSDREGRVPRGHPVLGVPPGHPRLPAHALGSPTAIRGRTMLHLRPAGPGPRADRALLEVPPGGHLAGGPDPPPGSEVRGAEGPKSQEAPAELPGPPETPV
jgi:hypothetical protein